MLSHLHDDEEDQGDKDIKLWVLPSLQVAQVVKVLSDALLSPRPVVQQGHQRLFLGQLCRTQEVTSSTLSQQSNGDRGTQSRL